MNVSGNLPSECFIKQIVFRCRTQILRTAHNVCDVHCVVVNYICKIVSWITVGFNKYLVLQLGIFNCYFAKNRINKCCGSFGGHFLAYNIRYALCQKSVNFLLWQVSAMAVISSANRIVLQLFKSFF